MAPVLIRRVLDSSIWSTLDAPQPTLSRRYIYTSINPTPLVIPLAVLIFLVVFGCTLSAQRLNRAKARNKAIAVSLPRDLGVPRMIRRPQAASVPPPMSDDVLDPPPPYVPLQILAPAHKRVNDTLERPADTERNVGNRGRDRSTLEV
jgi:hypothetical protein